MIESTLENARLLVIETEGQVNITFNLLNEFNENLLEKIANKDDYIDQLKTTIENDCFSGIHNQKVLQQENINLIRSIHIICVNLERIADFCVNIARQTHYLTSLTCLHEYDYQTMFSEIRKGLSLIIEVLEKRELSGALDICRIEYNLDKLYKNNFDLLMERLHKSNNASDIITLIFIFRYLERIGDALLNIGEALIFAIVGDRIKIRHFEALQQTLSESGFEGNISDIDFQSIWGSRSGCRISRIRRKKSSKFKAQGIFKEGTIKKIQKEKENLKRWDQVYPGLVPKIYGYYEKVETASLLVEFLPGCTLDQIVLTETKELIDNVIFIFEQTIAEIWEMTRKEGTFQTDYMDQLKTRSDAIQRVHPTFFRETKEIESKKILSSNDLIEQCYQIEHFIPAPFTIFIHGDFNANNIVYNHEDQRIQYIDLYRTRYADYVQDASVFLISFFRMPVFDITLRSRLNWIIDHFYKAFHNYANHHHDKTFEIRMAFALARSFFTSTRFEMNQLFAYDMALRSHYLMESIVEFNGQNWNDYQLPIDILFY